MIASQDVEDAASESVLYTRGIGSEVWRDGEAGEHVALIDSDESDALSIHTLAESMDGYVAVFESSPGSYHLWSLTPRSLTDVVMDSLSLRAADAEHVAQSRRRESFVVRCAPKVREDGTEYKPAPSHVATYDDGTGAVARGHHSVAQSLGADDVESHRLAGDERITTHSYMTVTDEAKEALR